MTEKKVKLEFYKHYLERYLDYDRVGDKKSNVINWKKTNQKIIDNFGKNNFGKEIQKFIDFIERENIDSKWFIRYSEKIVEDIYLRKDETMHDYFPIADTATKIIKESRKNFIYDLRSAWSSVLCEEVPVEAENLSYLSDKEKNEFFKDALNGKIKGYAFTLDFKSSEQKEFSINTYRHFITLFDFELDDFVQTHHLTKIKIEDVYKLSYRKITILEKYLKILYNKKEASKGIFEYNFWKSQMNHLNWLLFKKSPLIKAFVIAKTRDKIYKTARGKGTITKIQLDAIYSTRKLKLELSDEMGGWRMQKKHFRNLASSEILVSYDLKRGVIEDS